jgi:hypothetical protein
MTDTLRSICDQCTYLRNPQLDFIPAELERCREILLRDLQELVAAATANNEKSVVVLAGSILEGALYAFVNAQANYIAGRRGSFEFNPHHSLQNYLNIFNRWLNDLMPDVLLPDSVVFYRDLVHMKRELDSPLGVCAVAAREMLRVLDTLLKAFSEFVAPA